MDGLFTRCPHCQTVFRLSEQHLAAANGRVRCGACFQVFDAVNHRVRPVQKRSPELNRPAVTATTPAQIAAPADTLEQVERQAGTVHALRPPGTDTAPTWPAESSAAETRAAEAETVAPEIVPSPAAETAAPELAATGTPSAPAEHIAGHTDTPAMDAPAMDVAFRDAAGPSGPATGPTDADQRWTLTVDDIFAPLQGGLGAGAPEPQPASPPPPPPASVLDTFDDLGVDLDALPLPDAEAKAEADADVTSSGAETASEVAVVSDTGTASVADAPAGLDTTAESYLSTSEALAIGGHVATASIADENLAAESTTATTSGTAAATAKAQADTHSETQADADTATATPSEPAAPSEPVTPPAPASRPAAAWATGAPVLWQLPRGTGRSVAAGWSLFAEPARPRPEPESEPAALPAHEPRAADKAAAAGQADDERVDDRLGNEEPAAERIATATAEPASALAMDTAPELITAELITAEQPDDTAQPAGAPMDDFPADDHALVAPEAGPLIATGFGSDPLADLDLQLEREIADSLAAGPAQGEVHELPAEPVSGDEPAYEPAHEPRGNLADDLDDDLGDNSRHDGRAEPRFSTEPAFSAEPGLSEHDAQAPGTHEVSSFTASAFETASLEPSSLEPSPLEAGANAPDRHDPALAAPEWAGEQWPDTAPGRNASLLAAPELAAEPFAGPDEGADIFDRGDFSADSVPDTAEAADLTPLVEHQTPLAEHTHTPIRDLASDDASLLAAEAGIAAAALPDTPATGAEADAGTADDREPHSFGALHDHIDHALHPVAGDAHVHPASAVLAASRPATGQPLAEPDWRLEALDRPQPDAADFVAPRRFPWRGLLLTVLALLLLAVLVLQLLWPQRVALREDPTFAPWVERLCAHIECELPPRRDVGRISLLQRSVLKDASAGDQLNVELLIVNQAEFAQPFPDIELRFSDIDGKVVAQRRFKPGEYLRGDSVPAQMPVNVPVRISFAVVEPAVPATGFEFAFLPASP